MSKATLKKLEALHGAVADVLADGLTACEPKLVEKEDKEGNGTGEFMLAGYDARLVGQALSFLKDNDITVDHEEVNEDEVHAQLEALRAKKRKNNDPFADVPHH